MSDTTLIPSELILPQTLFILPLTAAPVSRISGNFHTVSHFG